MEDVSSYAAILGASWVISTGRMASAPWTRKKGVS
jgi:hypothetical protein